MMSDIGGYDLQGNYYESSSDALAAETAQINIIDNNANNLRIRKLNQKVKSKEVYFSVLIKTQHGLSGFVVSGKNCNITAIEYSINSMGGLIGYVGNNSLQEATKRVLMMENNEPKAWGVINV